MTDSKKIQIVTPLGKKVEVVLEVLESQMAEEVKRDEVEEKGRTNGSGGADMTMTDVYKVLMDEETEAAMS